MIHHLPILTTILTCLGLWLSGNFRINTRILGWSIALAVHLLFVLFGLMTEYRAFLWHALVVVVLLRNIWHNQPARSRTRLRLHSLSRPRPWLWHRPRHSGGSTP